MTTFRIGMANLRFSSSPAELVEAAIAEADAKRMR